MDLNIQNPASDSVLVNALNVVNGVDDVPAAVTLLQAEQGPSQGSIFIPSTSQFPMYFLIHCGDTVFIVMNGCSQLSHAVSVATGYAAPNASSYAVGCNSGAAAYAETVNGTLNLFRPNWQGNIVAIGHSFGGAGAMVLTRVRRTQQANGLIRCVTIGAPKTFKSEQWTNRTPAYEVQYANVGDPVPSLMPALSEFPAFYALLPPAFTIGLLQFTNRSTVYLLAADGSNPPTQANPWSGVTSPNDVPGLTWAAETKFNGFHGSQAYSTRIGQYVTIYYGTGHNIQPESPAPPQRVRPTLADLEAAGVNPANVPRNLPPNIANAGGMDATPIYRVKRCGRKYAVCRGGYSIALAVNKKAARTIRAAGNAAAASVGAADPLTLGIIDDSITTAYQNLIIQPMGA